MQPDTYSACAGLVGVLGGMGPLATLDFLRKILAATPASSDQQHVPVLVSSIPQIPDRASAFRGTGPSPLNAMLDCGRRVVAGGAGLIVIPCNTAHLWFGELRSELGLPMLHMADAALDEVAQICGPEGRIGLLATDATLDSGLYCKRTSNTLARRKVQWCLPTEAERSDWVMPAIAAVKAGELSTGRTLLQLAAAALRQRGAQAVVLGCTEIPIVLDADSANMPVVDATAALARQVVRWSMEQRNRRALATP